MFLGVLVLSKRAKFHPKPKGLGFHFGKSRKINNLSPPKEGLYLEENLPEMEWRATQRSIVKKP